MICMEVDGMKRVLFKVILPLAFIVVWLDMCYWICLGDNGMNWFQFWIMSGFPFGIQKMLVLLIPRNLGIAGSIGVLALDAIIGGMIGVITALLAIIIIICGFFIIYTVYFRFLKILIIVPLGAIACSTMAGNRMVSHTMSTYCKYFLSCVFEAVTMALAIVVCNAFINAGLPSFTGSYADWAQTLIYLCEMTFTIAMTVGSVKGAQTLTSKAFGL